MSQITLGVYSVRVGLRPDNPAFPSYLVYKGDDFIGKQFSMPSEEDCRWLERQRGVYATAEQSKKDFKKYGREYRKQGRPSNAERALREAALLAVQE